MATVNGTSGNDFIHEPGDGHSVHDVPSMHTYVEHAGATPGPDRINGLNGNDLIYGGAQDSVDGGSGNDILVGSGGTRLAGGQGNDTYYYTPGDTIVEFANEGIDTIKSPVSFSIAAMENIERLILLPEAGNATATGNASNNLIMGNGGNNVIRGMGGHDLLQGGPGDDTYVNPLGSSINDSSGYDTIRSDQTYSIAASSAVERLILTGSTDINGAGADLNETIIGQRGANILI
ncbi:MAG: hypothetical protein IT548_15400, partial [Alphaproteobacteria bacterium]|nr:hypothetical protein [Alphaproteobacteria bacterium]